MKKILGLCLLGFIFSSCNKDRNEYEKNLTHFKHLVENINTYFMDSTAENLDILNFYTEDFVFYSYSAGHKKGVKTSKVDYINNLNQMKQMNMSINIGHSIYLPGIDEESHEIDGSVRVYYGATLSLDTNNVEFSGYQTVNFEKGQISGIWEWADYGGVNNQLYKFMQ